MHRFKRLGNARPCRPSRTAPAIGEGAYGGGILAPGLYDVYKYTFRQYRSRIAAEHAHGLLWRRRICLSGNSGAVRQHRIGQPRGSRSVESIRKLRHRRRHLHRRWRLCFALDDQRQLYGWNWRRYRHPRYADRFEQHDLRQHSDEKRRRRNFCARRRTECHGVHDCAERCGSRRRHISRRPRRYRIAKFDRGQQFRFFRIRRHRHAIGGADRRREQPRGRMRRTIYCRRTRCATIRSYCRSDSTAAQRKRTRFRRRVRLGTKATTRVA